jgi:hypothetical protein
VVKKREIIPARPTVYKGIRMRSRLEADYAAALDRDGELWEYEPTCFAGPDCQWLPDFRIGHDKCYVELKPRYLIDYDTDNVFDVYDRVDKILKRMTVAWLSEPDVPLALIFWTYGAEQADAPLSIYAGRSGHGWVAYTPSTLDLPLLWPGMGQYVAAVAALQAGETGSSS